MYQWGMRGIAIAVPLCVDRMCLGHHQRGTVVRSSRSLPILCRISRLEIFDVRDVCVMCVCVCVYDVYVYIYINIYLNASVCVCVCVCIYI
jgi:hypothetical protein